MNWGMMMMTSENSQNDQEDRRLQAFLHAAHDDSAQLSPALRLRLLADADAVVDAAHLRGRSGFNRLRVFLRGAVAGWPGPALAGGVSAIALGFWVGIAAPMPDSTDWMLQALGNLDIVADRIITFDDPLLMGF